MLLNFNSQARFLNFIQYTDLSTVLNDMMTCFTSATNVLRATLRVSRSVSACGKDHSTGSCRSHSVQYTRRRAGENKRLAGWTLQVKRAPPPSLPAPPRHPALTARQAAGPRSASVDTATAAAASQPLQLQHTALN